MIDEVNRSLEISQPMKSLMHLLHRGETRRGLGIPKKVENRTRNEEKSNDVGAVFFNS